MVSALLLAGDRGAPGHAYRGPGPAGVDRAREWGVAVSAQPALQGDRSAGPLRRRGADRAAAAGPPQARPDTGITAGRRAGRAAHRATAGGGGGESGR
ncbi:hypothetical protein L083_5369 [Actinoplanes sp. N902-109]|nr:hypothetical protein L083_5369 [Actinoplanes sp. N902-109]